MRSYLSVILVFAVAQILRADGLIHQLPADGAWARYAAQQTMLLPNAKEKLTTNGTLLVASVGTEKVKDEPCRWLEFILEVQEPGAKAATQNVVKVLIPEKRLKKGKSPLNHWVKGWLQRGDQPPQALTKEMLAFPFAANGLKLFISPPLEQSKPLPVKEIDNKLGKLKCPGNAGLVTLKDADIRITNGKATTADMQVKVQEYVHEQSPFGGVLLRFEIEFGDRGSAEATLTLIEVGTGAKSRLPDHK